jgi:ssDNA-binding replication factor A large subunit
MTSTAVKEETVKLRPPHWVKVADLQKGSHGYNVKVQIIKVDKEDIKSNNDNKLTLVKAQVGDETGKAELQVRVDNPDFYK